MFNNIFQLLKFFGKIPKQYLLLAHIYHNMEGEMGDTGEELKLLSDEKLIATVKPHPLAFYDMYFIWLWTIMLSIVFFMFGGVLDDAATNPTAYFTGILDSITQPGDNPLLRNIEGFYGLMEEANAMVNPVHSFVDSYAGVGMWLTALIVSGLIISVLKIEFKWVFAMVGIGIISLMLAAYLDTTPESTYVFAIGFSLVGVGLIEVYRRAHTFYVTDRRIVTEVHLIYQKRNELSYDKINNIVFEKGVIGSIFGFGTIIPVTASGLGMGSDFSAATIGGATGKEGGRGLFGGITGGRSIQTPRVRSMYSLFGVREPEKLYQILSERLHDHVETPYLKKMSEQLEELKDELQNRDK